MVNNFNHYNVIVDKLGRRPKIGDCLYVTFGKTYLSHDKNILEGLQDVLKISDLKRIFVDIDSSKLTECGFTLENEFICKSEKSVFTIEQSDGYIDSNVKVIDNIGIDGQEMIVI